MRPHAEILRGGALERLQISGERTKDR